MVAHFWHQSSWVYSIDCHVSIHFQPFLSDLICNSLRLSSVCLILSRLVLTHFCHRTMCHGVQDWTFSEVISTLQAQNLQYQIFVHYIAFVRFTVWSPGRRHSTTSSVALTHEHQFSGARSHSPNESQLHHITPSICPAEINVTPAFSAVMYNITSSSSYTAQPLFSVSVCMFSSPQVCH